MPAWGVPDGTAEVYACCPVAAGLEGVVHYQETWDRGVTLARHAVWLQRTYWRTEVTVSLPRIKASASGFQPLVAVTDAEYVQALAALRLAAPEVGIVLSTRAPAALRDGLVRIAVTTMSAGSSTETGGYLTPGYLTPGNLTPGTAQEQSSISDEGSPAQVAAMLEAAGDDPVWKDAFPLVDVGCQLS